MPIPDYQTLMLPVLRYAQTQAQYRLSDVVEALAESLQLTLEERAALLPAGTQRVFTSRTSWACTYLKKAGLLDSVERGIYTITERGRQLLAENPTRIDNTLLRRYQEFTEFEAGRSETDVPKSPNKTSPIVSAAVSELDPQEAFTQSYHSIQQAIKDELLETVKRTHPRFFEKLVVDLLVAMGYGGSDEELRHALVRGPGDGGIDGVIKQDPLGVERIYVQAKRYNHQSVSREELQKFVGAPGMRSVRKGVFITSSVFAGTVKEYIHSLGDLTIVAIDGRQLVDLMLEYGIGVKERQNFKLYDIDTTYYEFETA